MSILFALALTVVGIVLLIVGIGTGDSIRNSFSRLFTRHLIDPRMWLAEHGCAGLFGFYIDRRN